MKDCNSSVHSPFPSFRGSLPPSPPLTCFSISRMEKNARGVNENDVSDGFLYELILDLTVEAERFGADPKKDSYERYILPSLKRHKHPKTYDCRIGTSKKPFTCPKCGYFHAHNYVIGKKPKRCRRCHAQLNP